MGLGLATNWISKLEELFKKGIEYFNTGYYFEAHDTFEEIWMDERGEDVRFYQGLVQLATGFSHLKMDNLKGAESQLNKGFAKLEKYKIGKTTDAYKAYSVGKLPPAHIHARAKRYAVKMFISHLHEIWYEVELGKPAPVP